MKNIFIFALIVCSAFNLRAQSIERSVIAPTGDSYVSGANLNVDYTVGEVMVTTIGNTANILTQGFQQPFSNTYVAVEENVSDPVQVVIFPNPFADQLNISIVNPKNDKYVILLFDVIGQLVFKADALPGYNDAAQLSLELGFLPTGKYFLQVMSDHNVVQTGKLIKISQ